MTETTSYNRADAEFKFMSNMVTSDSSDPSSMLSMPDLITTQVPPPFHILPLVWLFTLGKGKMGDVCAYTGFAMV